MPRPDGRLSATPVARGRQIDCSVSPDGKLKAFYRDRNFWVANCRRHRRKAGHDRRQREEADQERHRAAGCTAKSSARRPRSGGRRTARKVGVLPLRREPGEGLLPADDADVGSEHDGRRGVSEGRRAESDRRSVRVRRRDGHDDEGGRPRRQAVHRIPADGSKFTNDNVGHYVYNVALVAGRPRAAAEPHEPPAEHHGAGRAAARLRRSAGSSCAKNG